MTPVVPAKPDQPLLSVCMIVRNEAELIADALASVRCVADEIIVVDTGSVDQTPAIAESMGARVLHFQWQDHFSLARNFALSAARGRWILSIDADQRLNEASIPALKAALKNTQTLGQFVSICTHVRTVSGSAHAAQVVALGKYRAVRLIRNDARIRYQGRVHEDVTGSLLKAGSSNWPDSGIVLDDIGYVNASERDRKCARNLPLLKMACDDEPDAVYPVFKLAQTVMADDPEEGQQALMEALARLRRLPQDQWRLLAFLPNLISMIVASWTQQGRLIDCVHLCREFEAAVGHGIDFTAGAALARAGQWDAARKHLRAFLDRCAQLPPGHAWLDEELQAHPARACRHLAWIERMNEHLDAAVAWIEKGMAQAGPEQHMELLCEAMEIQILAGALQAANETLNTLAAEIGPQSPAFARLMHASARLAQASGDLATAKELARTGQARGDDLCAALLASLEVETGEGNAERLKQLYDAISGTQIDTLAVKLLIGHHLGIAWPHEVPEQCRID